SASFQTRRRIPPTEADTRQPGEAEAQDMTSELQRQNRTDSAGQNGIRSVTYSLFAAACLAAFLATACSSSSRATAPSSSVPPAGPSSAPASTTAAATTAAASSTTAAEQAGTPTTVAPLPTMSPPPPATTVSVATGQRDEQFPAISGV